MPPLPGPVPPCHNSGVSHCIPFEHEYLEELGGRKKKEKKKSLFSIPFFFLWQPWVSLEPSRPRHSSVPHSSRSCRVVSLRGGWPSLPPPDAVEERKHFAEGVLRQAMGFSAHAVTCVGFQDFTSFFFFFFPHLHLYVNHIQRWEQVFFAGNVNNSARISSFILFQELSSHPWEFFHHG